MNFLYSLIQVLQESEKKIQMCETIIQQRGASSFKEKLYDIVNEAMASHSACMLMIKLIFAWMNKSLGYS